MATTRQQSRSTGSKPARKPQTSRPTSAPRSRSRSASGANGRSTRASGGTQRSARAASQQPTASTNGRGATDTARAAISKIAKPVLAGGAAVAAIAGGAVLGKKALPRKRRFPASLGNPLSGIDMTKALKQIENVDLKKARKQVGKASKQFGELTKELRKAGEKAEQIGDALS
jgi:hypothetical protein